MLTLMATLATLQQQGKLIRIDPGLDPCVQEERMILAAPQLIEWLKSKLAALGSTWELDRTPQEQLAVLFEVFAAGEPLTFDHTFKKLHPRGEGVWELKTADVRVFGWFPKKDIFIAVVADTAERIKQHQLYPGYIGTVARFRAHLDLDEPKFLTGDDPHDVVSNYDFP
jgi:hypothetical protein